MILLHVPLQGHLCLLRSFPEFQAVQSQERPHINTEVKLTQPALAAVLPSRQAALKALLDGKKGLSSGEVAMRVFGCPAEKHEGPTALPPGKQELHIQWHVEQSFSLQVPAW